MLTRRSLLFLCVLLLLLPYCSGLLLLHMGGGSVRGDALPKLIALIEGTRRGIIETGRADIISSIDRIGEANAAFADKDRTFLAKCNGEWELLWTTEKETLFFASRGLFGSPVTRISQSIDLENDIINNLIAFDNGRSFSVSGTIAPDANDKRQLNFSFTSARLVVPPLVNLALPPVGKGWFKNVFVNDKYRLSRDVRGDYLVSRRL